MLRKVSGWQAIFPLPDRTRRLLWALAALDVMAVAWMLAVGDWFDTASRVTAVVTLGGNHLVVLWLAVVGFGILAIVAALTGGFGEVTRLHAVLLAIAGVVSVVALAGMLSVVALVVGTLLLLGHLARAVLR